MFGSGHHWYSSNQGKIMGVSIFCILPMVD